jgi:N6-L-threonylcarbamoyladenine synthase
MLVLGVETSCDETAAAVVADGAEVRSNVVASQLVHAAYGGVVPELAARKHIEALPSVVDRALSDAGVVWPDIEGIAVTRGPGLVGALLSGWCYARGLARALRRPYVGIHHLAAHVHGALMPHLATGGEVAYPLLALVVSGGHTSLYRLPVARQFSLLGETRDDAAGEAFDKVAALLGLDYPGGPVIDKLSVRGDPRAVPLPRAKLSGPFEFSFSGLKTAVRRQALAARLQPGEPNDPRVLDLVASFQAAVVDMLAEPTAAALRAHPARGLVVAGGVAANRALRSRMEGLADEHGVPLYLAPIDLSTDNAAMVAGWGGARLQGDGGDPFDLSVVATWPLGETAGPF